MGGILLLFASIGVFVIIFWYIYIETSGNKTLGFLGFDPKHAGKSLHNNIIKKKKYLAHDVRVGKLKTSYKT